MNINDTKQHCTIGDEELQRSSLQEPQHGQRIMELTAALQRTFDSIYGPLSSGRGWATAVLLGRASILQSLLLGHVFSLQSLLLGQAASYLGSAVAVGALGRLCCAQTRPHMLLVYAVQAGAWIPADISLISMLCELFAGAKNS